MPQKTDLNVSPYYDDYSEEKNFSNILFRPGFAVQARELSQIQSLLQNKMQKVGDHLFKDGAMVVPGQLSFVPGLYAVRIQTTFNGETVNGTALYNENQVVHCSAFLKDILARRPEKEYNVA